MSLHSKKSERGDDDDYHALSETGMPSSTYHSDGDAIIDAKLVVEQDESKKPCAKIVKLLLYAAGAVAGQVGQVILLDLFIASFTNFPDSCEGAHDMVTGPYFILLMCAILFNVAFWAIVLVRGFMGLPASTNTWEYARSKNHYKLVLTGVFDALNGFLIVYSSPATRVPSDLQPILMQSLIPFTLFFSYVILRKRYVPLQLAGAVLVIGAILLSLGPTFTDIINNTDSLQFQSGGGWAALFLLGCVPAVLMNIFEESIFMDTDNKFDIWVLLAIESGYQLLVFLALFWLDTIHGFGTSENVTQWADNVADGFQCFFSPGTVELPPNFTGTNHCESAWWIGTLFSGAYVASYVFGALLMKEASANFYGLVVAMANPLAVVFWFVAEPVNQWQCGSPYNTRDIAYACSALVPLVVGVYLFRRFEKDKLRKTKSVYLADGEIPPEVESP